MPIKIPNDLPAFKTLKDENIFMMTEERALHQDIRPLKIAILNLMPVKSVTETQLLRILSNSPLQVDITLIHPDSHLSKNTSKDYLLKYYQTFEEIKNEKFDGLIITGAPVELLDFEQVDYWEELTEIMAWSLTNVTSTYHVCWGAQAGLYYHYGIPKYELDKKMFGVFQHSLSRKDIDLFRGFDDVFYVPHSRHTEIKREDIEKVSELEILSESEEAGVYLVIAKGGRQIFATGHSEYDALTLQSEYIRDISAGLPIEIPKHYFPEDNPKKTPIVKWRSHSNLLYLNWLEYYVYENTPFEL